MIFSFGFPFFLYIIVLLHNTARIFLHTCTASLVVVVVVQDESTVYILADSGFFKNFLYQGGVKSTVSWVFEDLKFKISEGYDQNWVRTFWNFKLKVLNYSRNCSLHATLIPNLVKTLMYTFLSQSWIGKNIWSKDNRINYL